MKNSFSNIKDQTKIILIKEIKNIYTCNFLLAVSGGADSVLLAHIFKSLNLNFSIAHVNFQLRSDESEADELFVKNLAKSLGVNYFVKGVATKSLKKKRESIQMIARTIRYDYFNEMLQKHEFNYIVVAHHANDQVETVLMNLFRGCGIDGLTGMQFKNGNVIRPFLLITRNSIENALKQNKLKFRTDSSNSKNDYKRNYLRNIVIPTIEKKWPGIEKTMLQNIENFKGLKSIVAENKTDFNFSNSFDISVKTLTSNANYLNSFKESCAKNGFNVAQVSKLLSARLINESKIIKNRTGFLEVKNGIVSYTINKIEPEIEPEIIIKGRTVLIKNLDSSFYRSKVETISFKKIKGEISLVKWKAGDRMFPLGMNNRKKISDILTDLKLTAAQKKKIYILRDTEKPLWLVGFRIDNRLKLDVKEPEGAVLTIKVV